jgi:hypothetical protein
MHPPFGFALFYLRGVAPKEVKSSDIYWGAIPWVLLQLILVALVIAFPKQVTMLLDEPVQYDLQKIQIDVPGIGERDIVVPGSDPGQEATKDQDKADKAGQALEDAFKK